MIALAVAACACGGAQPAPAPQGPTCDAVGEHLLRLAEADNASRADPELAAGIRGLSTQRCRDAPWSLVRRECLMAARTQDATLACPPD